MHFLLLPATEKRVFVPVTIVRDKKEFSPDDIFDRKQTTSKDQKTSIENF